MRNAQWWVRYTDQNGRNGMIALRSSDLVDVKKAHKRAIDVAKARLIKRGIKASNLQSSCVG